MAYRRYRHIPILSTKQILFFLFALVVFLIPYLLANLLGQNFQAAITILVIFTLVDRDQLTDWVLDFQNSR